MDIGISVRIDRDANEGSANVPSQLDGLITRLVNQFANYQPERKGYSAVDFRIHDQRALTEIMEWMDRHDERYQLVLCDFFTPDELARARWVRLSFSADYADMDGRGAPLNTFPVTLCSTCGWYDETIVPEPYKVSTYTLRRKEDVLPAHNGIMIADERVKNLLSEVAGDQFEWGTTCCMASKEQLRRERSNERQLFWIRPTNLIGKSVTAKPGSLCPKCGVPITCADFPESQGKIFWDRPMVEHFGQARLDIACIGSWYGGREIPGKPLMCREIVVSGGLFAYLFNSRVKGFVFPDQIVFSASGEPPIEDARRFADLKKGNEDMILRKRI